MFGRGAGVRRLGETLHRWIIDFARAQQRDRWHREKRARYHDLGHQPCSGVDDEISGVRVLLAGDQQQ